ncbi:Major Facilitator Superfamily protein [Marininema mesophilum]|uniref:Major Facilitator Superfamily protein n=1 Tax=Marininema mesophilum TaxID=1048340 RepID=A0A1H2UV45_9BACL|nr:MFS transporter [Marininema mesophilum]SDW59925.1 Major Facilitator Superfamily protein [Marininema mesophilum]
MLTLLKMNKPFRHLISGAFFSSIGDAIMAVGILVAIYQQTHSPVAISWLTLAQVLPFLIISLYAGVQVDQLNPKKTLMISDLLRFIILIILFFLWDLNYVGLIGIYVVVFLIYSVSTFFDPSSLVVLKSVVEEPEELLVANSVKQMIIDFSKIAGALIGGAIASSFDIKWIFIINAFSYLISLIFISFIVYERKMQKSSKKLNIRKELKSGWKYIAKKASLDLKKSIYYIVIINIPISILTIQMTLISQRSTIFQPGNYLGLMNSLYMGGSVLGSITIGVLLKKTKINLHHIPLLIFIYSLLTLIPTILFNEIITLLSFFLIGLMAVVIQIIINSIYQREVPNEFMGRVSSFRSMILRIPPPLLSAIYGVMVQYIGLTLATLIITLFSILSLYILLINKDDNY